MADVILKSIQFPGLPDRYVIGGSDMTAGLAEQLLSEKYTTDQEPYTFRASGGDGADREYDEIVGGSLVWNQLVPVPSSSKSTTANNVTITDNRNGTYTVSTTSDGASADTYVNIGNSQIISTHKYFYASTPNGGSNSTFYSYVINVAIIDTMFDTGNGHLLVANGAGNVSVIIMVKSGTKITSAVTFKPMLIDLTQMFGTTIADYIYSLEQATAGAGVAFFKKLFPKDYYAYDAGTMMHVSGLSSHDMVGFNAWDEEWEVGSLNISTGAPTTDNSRIRSKNYNKCLPSVAYYKGGVYIFWYDQNKNFISYHNATDSDIATSPSHAFYFKIATVSTYGTTYKNDICINISDPSRNGEYEPYIKHSYPLDDSLTLRGIPKLDSNNQLYYDGDTYAADGTVTRKYGIVDLGTLNIGYNPEGLYFYCSIPGKLIGDYNVLCSKYVTSTSGTGVSGMNDKEIKGHYATINVYIKDSSYTDAATFKTAMSGVMLVYELATPTTEQATPFTNPQICDPNGTEEYVTTLIVPVGHYTKYPANLRSAIERVMEQVPEAPSANGTYTLKATRTSSGVTYAWTAS